ncbi:MAG: hypothetical protein H6873_09580 [Hyphomicrobiaceae bacterium]|nr:hypothetical protein [Hyphomicrobiaceae bacterium]
MPPAKAIAAVPVLFLSTPCFADSLDFDGSSILSLSRNQEPRSCWVEMDCPEGEICHAAVTIRGEAAANLAKILAAKVEKDAEFADWGLEIYVTNDGMLYCDVTEPDDPRCTVNYNPQKAELEGPLSCE